MKIDVNSLRTYNALARDGAESAVDSLTQLTGIETSVEVTDVSLMATEDLQREFHDNEFSGVSIDLSGGMSGESVLVFDERARDAITSVLAPADDPEMQKSSIEEVGNIMTSGFVDGWANYLNVRIKSSPPEYVEGQGQEVLPRYAMDTDRHLLLFRSRVKATEADVDDALDFRIMFVPDRASLARVLEPREEDSISMEKLEVFNEMTKQGAKNSAGNITTMTGLETSVNISRVSLVPIEDIPAEVGTKRYVGTSMKFRGKMSGYLVILFDHPSARAIVDALVPVETDGEWGEMERGALQELGNIMTSGFVDGWANYLNSRIKHSPPEFVADAGASIMKPIVKDIAESDDHAFLLDSSIETNTDRVFTCQLLALPRRSELQSALDEILVES